MKGIISAFSDASGRKSYLPAEADKELANVLTMLSERGLPQRTADIKRFAFDYAKANGIQEDRGKKKAGYCRFQGFVNQNPNLSIMKPESFSAARAAGMNPEVVGKWF